MSSIVKEMKQKSLLILGCEAEPWDDVWKRVKDLSKAFGQSEVLSAFEDWAKSKEGEVVDRPVASFLKVATGILRGQFSLKQNPKLTELVNDLVYEANDVRIAFAPEQKQVLGKLLEEYSVAEIKAVFKEYCSVLENKSFVLSRAAKTFCDTADQLLLLHRRRNQEAKKQSESYDRSREQMQREADKLIEETKTQQAGEQDLVEETLGE